MKYLLDHFESNRDNTPRFYTSSFKVNINGKDINLEDLNNQDMVSSLFKLSPSSNSLRASKKKVLSFANFKIKHLLMEKQDSLLVSIDLRNLNTVISLKELQDNLELKIDRYPPTLKFSLNTPQAIIKQDIDLSSYIRQPYIRIKIEPKITQEGILLVKLQQIK